MASSTTKPHRQHQRHQREVIDRVTEQVHHRERAHNRHGQRQAGDDGGGNIAQEKEDDQHYQAERQIEREFDVAHRVANGNRSVVEGIQMDRLRDFLAKSRKQALDVVHHLDGVGAGLALNGQHHGVDPVVPGGHLVVLHAVDDLAQRLQPHRRAVAISDDERPVGGGVLELAVGLHDERLVRSEKSSGGQVDVGILDGVRHLIDADAARGQRLGIKLHPHRVFLRAIQLHLRHAGDHGDALRHQRVGVVIDGGGRKRVGVNRHVKHRLVGRVHLLVGRRRGHVRRKPALRAGDGGLHILRGGVNVAAQAELQGDLRAALRAHGTHGLKSGDGGELALQHGGYGGGHGLRARAGQRGAHLDGGIIDIGQIADRQFPIGNDAKNQNGQHRERRHDGPADKEFCEVHKAVVSGKLSVNSRQSTVLSQSIGLLATNH